MVGSANAGAGGRGTVLVGGVALSGAALVTVSEGEVAVSGEGGSPVGVGAGYSVVSSHRGDLDAPKQKGAKFDSWMVDNAKVMETHGKAVATGLQQRLDRRRGRVEKLVAEQRRLRKIIEGLDRRRKSGEPVSDQIRSAHAELKAVTAKIDDMAARLEGAFALFERWGEVASTGAIADSAAIALMAQDVARIARGFADMIEEGTDISMDRMDGMMRDMGEGEMMGPGDSAADELFGK